MMGGVGGHDVVADLARLISLGVEVHTQIVVVPGLNDGAHLARSVRDLAALHPGVRSVSIVPVGVTRYHSRGCRALTRDEMRATMGLVRREQARNMDSAGVRFAYLSDEWYLSLGEALPREDEYDGLDLVENGVGAAREFMNEAGDRLAAVFASPKPQTLVTGTLFGPVLREVVNEYPNLSVEPVANAFFGTTVTVAGLLTGEDVVRQLACKNLGTRVVLPPEMFGGPGCTTLDGLTADAIGRELQHPTIVGGGRQGGGSGPWM
jgi:NifB/MoaA-like Fe-S oxidoreductase